MTEYFLHIWGGAMPHLERELGIKDNYYWFKSEEERRKFIKQISHFSEFGLIIDKKDGEMTHKRTIAEMDLIYNNKTYHLEYDFGYEYPEESANFMFFEGNYSCDCNKSLFIQDIEENFPELNCGDEIKIQNFVIKYLD